MLACGISGTVSNFTLSTVVCSQNDSSFFLMNHQISYGFYADQVLQLP